MTLATALMTVPGAVEAQLKRDAGINFFEYSILVALARPAGHAVRMTGLAMMAGGSLSRLSHAVSRLERQGLVRRRASSGEVRCVEAVLTDAGLAVLEAAAPDHVREVRRLVFDVLTPEQVGQLEQIGRRLVQAAAPETAAILDRAISDADEAAHRQHAAKPPCPSLEGQPKSPGCPTSGGSVTSTSVTGPSVSGTSVSGSGVSGSGVSGRGAGFVHAAGVPVRAGEEPDPSCPAPAP
jgi:DNA-binding MarR family transcriptional regulator